MTTIIFEVLRKGTVTPSHTERVHNFDEQMAPVELEQKLRYVFLFCYFTPTASVFFGNIYNDGIS